MRAEDSHRHRAGTRFLQPKKLAAQRLRVKPGSVANELEILAVAKKVDFSFALRAEVAGHPFVNGTGNYGGPKTVFSDQLFLGIGGGEHGLFSPR